MIVYMVTYRDDDNKMHMTFVRGFSAVRFIENRFDNVHFEVTDQYYQNEED